MRSKVSISNGEKEAIARVRSFLDSHEYVGDVFHTEDTIFTVQDASRAVGAPEAEILKSILLRVNKGEYYVLALMSGVNRVDAKKIKNLLHASNVTFAAPEYCESWAGFKPGGVPPVGYPEQPKTFLDQDLFLYKTVWSAAGTEHAFFPVSPEKLMEMTGGTAADIKKDPQENNV